MIRVRNFVVVSILLAGLAGSAAAAPLTCSDHVFDVTLAPGETDTYQVVGTLCSKGDPSGKTLQVLIHGSTYSRIYWDFPYQSNHYSYVRAATRRGYATLNLDRIGIGASDHPDGALLDGDSNAFVVHQIVQDVRAGTTTGVAFDKVVAVGHSLGSFISIILAGTYPGDVDGVILTGVLHDVNLDFVNNVLVPSLYPAAFDPRFAGQSLDLNYLTTLPGTRLAGFYYAPNADPVVVAIDESTKETVTGGELDAVAVLFGPLTSLIDVPALVVVGEFDGIFCGNLVDCSDRKAVQSYEEGFFSPAACVETAVIGESGHDLNLHTNARSAYAKMLAWTQRRVGRNAGPAPDPCVP